MGSIIFASADAKQEDKGKMDDQGIEDLKEDGMTCRRCNKPKPKGETTDLCACCHDVEYPDKARDSEIDYRIERFRTVDEIKRDMTPAELDAWIRMGETIRTARRALPVAGSRPKSEPVRLNDVFEFGGK